jgi:membrane protein DedA with SNARE-associated domain
MNYSGFQDRIYRIDGLLIPVSAAAILAGVLLLFDPAEDMLLDKVVLSLSSPLALASAVRDIVPTITMAMASWGYGGVFFLMLAESVSLPIPSEVILPYAGYLVFSGRFDFWVTVLLSTAAGTTGALVDYFIGLKMSQNRTLGSIRRVVFIDKKLLTVVEQWFNRHGSSTVFISRMVPGVRTLASFPAGATRMPMSKFVVYTTSGCLIWSTLLTYVGVYLGRNWVAVLKVSGYLSAIALGAAAIILVGWFLVKRNEHKKRAELESHGKT